MLFDYMTLKVIWWCLVGVLLIGFTVTGGFDFGVAMWLPWLGKDDMQRRVIINTIGPTWEGNQTWFIAAGASLFAAWPLVYGAAFSGFYVALMFLLFALFLRPVGFDYRSKLESPRWRNSWDWALFVAGVVPPLIFGVAFGNLLQGVPFHYDNTMRLAYTGGFLDMLNPFGLLAGVLGVAMLAMHGATFLYQKSDGDIAERARKAAIWSACATIALFALAGLWVATGLDAYRITAMPDPHTAFMPQAKTVERAVGAWMDNYRRWPMTRALPLLGLLGAALAIAACTWRRSLLAFLASCAAVSGVLLTAGAAMFPFIMPSSLQPSHSLTAWDAVSSHRSLGVMFWVLAIMLPIVIGYTSWVYGIMRGKVTQARIRENSHESY